MIKGNENEKKKKDLTKLGSNNPKTKSLLSDLGKSRAKTKEDYKNIKLTKAKPKNYNTKERVGTSLNAQRMIYGQKRPSTSSKPSSKPSASKGSSKPKTNLASAQANPSIEVSSPKSTTPANLVSTRNQTLRDKMRQIRERH
jgi:hypothetical protein